MSFVLLLHDEAARSLAAVGVALSLLSILCSWCHWVPDCRVTLPHRIGSYALGLTALTAPIVYIYGIYAFQGSSYHYVRFLLALVVLTGLKIPATFMIEQQDEQEMGEDMQTQLLGA